MCNVEEPEADREGSLSRGQNSGIGQGQLEMDSARVASWRPYSPEQNREKQAEDKKKKQRKCNE